MRRTEFGKLPWNFVLDLDGVVFDFIGDFEAKFGMAHRDYVRLVDRYPDQEKDILQYVRDPQTYKDLLVLPLGLEIAKYLWGRGDTAIHIVSSRPFPAFDITKKRLSEIDLRYDSITFKKDKAAFIKALEPDMAIDDIIEILVSIQPIQGVLAKAEYNQTPFFTRISTIDQFTGIWQRFVNENVPNNSRGVRMA